MMLECDSELLRRNPSFVLLPPALSFGARLLALFCHSGAAQRAEPGIHNHEMQYWNALGHQLCSNQTLVVMDSGLDAAHRPGMTMEGFRTRASLRRGMTVERRNSAFSRQLASELCHRRASSFGRRAATGRVAPRYMTHIQLGLGLEGPLIAAGTRNDCKQERQPAAAPVPPGPMER
jgi:hypothetical protein